MFPFVHQIQQLSESEELLELRDRENRELSARVAELERMLAAGGGGKGGGGLTREASQDGADVDDWREDQIAKAEAELKAAMAAGDPERLKKAIANASQTVAKARARGSHVVKKQQILKGGGGDGGGGGGGGGESTLPTPPVLQHQATAADPLSEEEKLYIRFHEIATGRKLALASRGFEVQNIFIDNLYDLAVTESVPHSEWGEFLRLQLPSPRPEDEVDGADAGDEGGAADGGGEQPVATIEWTDSSGVVHKVKKAMAKLTKMKAEGGSGWRSKMKPVCRTYRPPAEHFGMDQPDEMPAPEEEGGMAPSLAKSVMGHSTSSAGGAVRLLDMSDVPDSGPSLLSPTGTEAHGESRAQRYNKALRDRMEARDSARR